MVDYKKYFSAAVDKLKEDGNYRVFTDLARYAGYFPKAKDYSNDKDITMWCSNDYLGMGQHLDVVSAMQLQKRWELEQVVQEI